MNTDLFLISIDGRRPPNLNRFSGRLPVVLLRERQKFLPHFHALCQNALIKIKAVGMQCHPGSRSKQQEDTGKRLLIERKVLGNEKRLFEFPNLGHLFERLLIKRCVVDDGRIPAAGAMEIFTPVVSEIFRASASIPCQAF